MSKKLSLDDQKVNTKIIIMSAWIALMCLYIYCDILTFFRPGTIGGIMSGKMGFLDVSPMSLFSASLLMVVPSIMILVSALTAASVSRVINMAVSAIYFLVNIGNLIGETWAYYFLFGLLEIRVVILIFVISLRWPKERGAIAT
ncbi:MAG TPA: DUF6326 family protein [Rectinemataceae bacterium]|nr:DUF6326 family protein [Rectinemataceae bacterium]